MNAQKVIVILVLLGLSFVVREFWERFWVHVISSFGGSFIFFVLVAAARRKNVELKVLFFNFSEWLPSLLKNLGIVLGVSLVSQIVFTLYLHPDASGSLPAFWSTAADDFIEPTIFIPRYIFLAGIALWSIHFLFIFLGLVIGLGFVALSSAEESGEDSEFHAEGDRGWTTQNDFQYSSTGGSGAGYDLDRVLDLEEECAAMGFSYAWLENECRARGLLDALARARAAGLIRNSPGRKKSASQNRTKRTSNFDQRSTGTSQQQSKAFQNAKQTELDPYTILGLARGASKEQIKAAYREHCKKFHPDLFENYGKEFVELSNKKFKAIQEAYDVLSKRVK
jgi:hypothetical protein